MKILIVDAYYPRYLEYALGRMDITGLGYRELLDRVLNLRFGTADFYSRNLRELGHEADDIIFNCEVLQRRWAEEHGGLFAASLKKRLTDWLGGWRFRRRRVCADAPLVEIAMRQVEAARPDVLYLQSLDLFPPEALRSLRGIVRLIVGQIASPLPEKRFLREFDLILTSFPHFVGRFRAMGIASEYFRIGFDPIVLKDLQGIERHRSCTFVGGISPAHRSRIAFLERLARSVDIEFFGYGAETLGSSSAILGRYRGEAWAMDMYRVLVESRITVNAHIDVAEHYANNMRLYEATGCGALLVTDEKDNLAELFRPNVEVVTYRSVEEAIEKIRYFSSHPEEARCIAHAGQVRTLTEHTYRNRMEELVNILGRYLRGRARESI
mgnify:CR=1 FL=1